MSFKSVICHCIKQKITFETSSLFLFSKGKSCDKHFMISDWGQNWKLNTRHQSELIKVNI